MDMYNSRKASLSRYASYQAQQESILSMDREQTRVQHPTLRYDPDWSYTLPGGKVVTATSSMDFPHVVGFTETLNDEIAVRVDHYRHKLDVDDFAPLHPDFHGPLLQDLCSQTGKDMVRRMVSPKSFHVDLWDPSTGPYSDTDPTTVARLTLYALEVLHHFTRDPSGNLTRRGNKTVVRLFAEALEHVPTPRTYTALHKHTVSTKTFDFSHALCLHATVAVRDRIVANDPLHRELDDGDVRFLSALVLLFGRVYQAICSNLTHYFQYQRLKNPDNDPWPSPVYVARHLAGLFTRSNSSPPSRTLRAR